MPSQTGTPGPELPPELPEEPETTEEIPFEEGDPDWQGRDLLDNRRAAYFEF